MANLYRWTDDELEGLEQQWLAMNRGELDWGVFPAQTREAALTFLAEILDKSVAYAVAHDQEPTWQLWQVQVNAASDDPLLIALSGNGPSSPANARAICNILLAFPYLLSTVRAYRERAAEKRADEAVGDMPQ